ncbi:HAMP domain-containing sensor histidine kinase [Streptomyces sp. NPDC001985]|uniref:sensor histidine kinase n=1 Tax=Streptomyces sp. NPDC001985 TaxID=3154406 RepID=UPI00332AA33A
MIRARRPWPALSLRARVALLAAVLVAIPLAMGASFVVLLSRQELLSAAALRANLAGEQAVRDGRMLETCDRLGMARTAAPAPRILMYCAVEDPAGGERGGTLSPWPWPALLGDRPRPLRMTTPANAPPGIIRLVTVNTLEREQARLTTVGRRAAVSVIMVTAAVAATAWFTARRALRPMEVIRLRFTDLSEHHLDQRVPVPRTDNEISRLARTLNETLARLELSVEQQRRFTADASHELRTPLAALRAELEIALAQPGNADWPRVVERALGDAMRLQQLTADLLVLARIDAGAVRPAAGHDVDLGRLVRSECGRRSPAAHLALAVSAGPGPSVVRGHPLLLAQVLGNLLDNAERYAAGRISVRLRHEARSGRALLEVSDDGPGIPAQDRERVFERFSRLDDARSHRTGGAGLGLAIAHHVVGLHQGSLAIVDSPRGARFVVSLPCAHCADGS